MYRASKFFPAARLKLFKCIFEAERQILVKRKRTPGNTENYIQLSLKGENTAKFDSTLQGVL